MSLGFIVESDVEANREGRSPSGADNKESAGEFSIMLIVVVVAVNA